MMRWKLIVVSGASGAGKDTLVKLLKRAVGPDHLRMLQSTTTRNPRPGDGDAYRYIAREFFELIKRDGGFLWTKEVHGNHYGTAPKHLERALKGPSCTVAVLTPDCLIQMRDAAEGMGCAREEMLFIHVLSPGEEVLRNRLAERGESAESVEERIAECRGWDEKVCTFPLDITYVTNSGTGDDLALWVKKFLEGQ